MSNPWVFFNISIQRSLGVLTKLPLFLQFLAVFFFCTCGLFPSKQNQVDVNVLVKHIFSYTDPQGRHFWLCNMSIVSNENHMKSYANLILNISHIFFQTTKNNSSQSHEKHITSQLIKVCQRSLHNSGAQRQRPLPACHLVLLGPHILKASGRVIIRLIFTQELYHQ